MHIDTVILDPAKTLRQVVAELNRLGDVVAAGTASPTITTANIVITSPSDPIKHMILASGTDKGFRFDYNYMEPPVLGSTYSVPGVHQLFMFFEQDATWSLTYFKPQTTAPGIWDGLAGKSFAIKPGGFGALGQAGEFLFMYSGQIGRGMEIGTSDFAPNNPIPKIRLHGNNSANPVEVYINGSLRTLQSKDFTALVAGDKVVCYT